MAQATNLKVGPEFLSELQRIFRQVRSVSLEEISALADDLYDITSQLTSLLTPKLTLPSSPIASFCQGGAIF